MTLSFTPPFTFTTNPHLSHYSILSSFTPSLTSTMSHDHSSKRHWNTKVESQNDDVEEEEFTPLTPCPTTNAQKETNKKKECSAAVQVSSMTLRTRKLQAVTAARLKSVMSAFSKNRVLHRTSSGLSGRVVGTMFGSKHGHVHFAFQKDPISSPSFLIELATPITGLVNEMASGLVRIALECDKTKYEVKTKTTSSSVRLLQESVFRTYCNGKRCGFATRRECGEKEWRLLKALEPISMGAGVLPGNGGENDMEEVMYMRAKFERVIGSKDSEAFYMMNPDSNGAPELSVYLLRV